MLRLSLEQLDEHLAATTGVGRARQSGNTSAR